MAEGIDNAFDHTELCLVLQVKVVLSEIGFIFTEIHFTIELSGINFLLHTFSTDGKWDFQVASLLHATVKFQS